MPSTNLRSTVFRAENSRYLIELMQFAYNHLSSRFIFHNESKMFAPPRGHNEPFCRSFQPSPLSKITWINYTENNDQILSCAHVAGPG